MSDDTPPANGVKTMLTAADHHALRELGFSQCEIDEMASDEGTRYLALARGEHPPFEFDNIPSHLQDLPQWMCWRFVVKKGKLTKVPFKFDGTAGKVDDRDTWCTFEKAKNAYRDATKRAGG